MDIVYTFYNPDTLEEIDSGKFIGLPFFGGKNYCWYMKPCAIMRKHILGGYKLLSWTIDKDSELYQDYYGVWQCETFTYYISLSVALLIQQDMTDTNPTLLTDLMTESNCKALIVHAYF